MAHGYTNGFPVDNDPSLAADSSVLVPSQQAVKAYVTGITGFSLPLPVNQGGTGNTNAVDAFNALSPLSTLGDTLYNNGTNDVRLAGNTTATKQFLTQTGTGSVSAAPAWGALVDGDIPSALTGKTYNGLTVSTATANQIDLTNGTTTLTVTSGGTLGTMAYQTAANYTLKSADANQDMNNNAISEIKTATFNSQATLSTTTGSVTIDWSAAQNYKQNEPTGTITYTFTNPPGPCHLQLLIDSDGVSTAQTINWPSLTWIGATWTGANNKKAIINLWFDGTNYFAQGANQV